MKEGNKLWARDELILALNLYLKLPFGKMHSRTPEIMHLANLIDRTPNSVAMRLTNFASVDPFHQQRGVKGLEGGKKQVQPIWNEFINNRDELLFESEKILAAKEHTVIENKYAEALQGTENMKGEDKFREVKTRVNQNVFRQIVIANYAGKCAITGIDIPDLLIASHIIPWSKSEQERLNPENGICLSPLYDRAYDKGYIGINEDFEILLSPRLKEKHTLEYHAKHFAVLTETKINLPQRYHPKKEFLQYHMDTVFRR
ncbi:HNH endonuclease [Pseudoflavitalea sp. X16]|uniref:HNH endonuclease n=1 Tax=Paraflavitalea devenefica TaxID=2716334 RepID=UPI00142284C8|nr:HNH endonuclease [Paraflavitalea devenefica]NII24369.1 HNH endonuclease [Paraflavitalea devenefica]